MMGERRETQKIRAMTDPQRFRRGEVDAVIAAQPEALGQGFCAPCDGLKRYAN